MRIEKVLHTNLLDPVAGLHAKRAGALTAMVCSLVHGAFLTVTSLGRRLQSPAKTKHNIKRADRTLSNKALQQARLSIYRTLCARLCGHLKHPVILVDWSDIAEQKRLLVIRAALVVDGRALPLYEEVYALHHYSKPRTHRAFLNTLKSLLPAHCIAIIVTDAGFRGPWFKAVEAQGWYWLGRVRNCINYRTVSRQTWRQTRTLYPRATSKAQYLGECELSSRRPYRCHLYLYKKTKQYRRVKRSTYHQAKHSDNEVFARQQREPWLLATNLDPVLFKALHIVRLYGKRMGIEAGFRDLKSEEFGFGLALSRSRRLERLNMLLLIAALATVCLWWVGLIAEQSNWHRQFQANTVRDRRVLSVPYLGREVVRRCDYLITMRDLIYAHQLLLQHISTAHEL